MKRNFTYDASLVLKDAGAVTASGAAEVDSVEKILDMGPALFLGNLIIDVSELEISSNDEKYKIIFQGSESSDFSNNVQDIMAVELGAAEVLTGDIDSTTGRIVLPVCNEFFGDIYQYVRLYTIVSGSVTTGIDYTARLGA